ncbi:MAG: TonB family protein, partial [Flavitalea sp.]
PLVKPPEQKKIETTQYTPPKIVPDEMVKPDEMPPDVDKLEDTKISLISQEGVKDDGIVAPPIEDGKGVVEAPKKIEEDFDKPFTKVEIDAQYPGGTSAWFRFLNKNLANQYPEDAVENGIQGTVVVQFIVDREGAVSDVRILSGPKELQEAAIKVIKKSGKWEPGIQNGRKVPSYKKQPIVFKLADG